VRLEPIGQGISHACATIFFPDAKVNDRSRIKASLNAKSQVANHGPAGIECRSQPPLRDAIVKCSAREKS
jgi:hypothetical protein